MRPHVLGIDDGPFDRHVERVTPVVAVMMEGADLIEGVAISSFPIDGADATGFLAEWILEQRWFPSLQAVVFGGISIAGLGIVELDRLHALVRIPVISVTRRDTAASDLHLALGAAGYHDRIPAVQRTPPARPLPSGIYVASVGADDAAVSAIVRACCRKGSMPEPLRLAHIIATALVRGSSYGRV